MKKIFIFIVVFFLANFLILAKTSETNKVQERYNNLMEKAGELIEDEEYSTALSILKECHSLYPQIKESLDDDNCLDLLLFCCVELDDYEGMYKYAKEKAEGSLKKYGKNDIYLRDLQLVAHSLAYLKRFEEAIKIGEECYVLSESLYGKNSIENLNAYYYIALYSLDSGAEDKGLKILEDIIKLTENAADDGILSIMLYCNSFQGIVDYYVLKENYRVALKYMLQLLEQEKRKMLASAPELVISEIEKVSKNFETLTKDYIKMEELEKEALDIARTVYEPNSIEIGLILYNLAKAQVYNEKYQEGLKNNLEAQRIFELYDFEATEAYAKLLMNISVNYNYLSQNEKAIEYIDKALKNWNQHSGKETINYAYSLMLLSVFYIEDKNFEDGEKYIRESMQLINKLAIDDEQFNKYNFMDRFMETTHTLWKNGRYSDALHLGDILIDIYQNSDYKDLSIYAILLDNLASFYYSMGYSDKAYEISYECISLYHKMSLEELTPNYKDYMIAAINYISFAYSVRDYDNAIQLGENVLSILKELGSDNSNEYSRALHSLSMVYTSKEEYDKSLDLELEALKTIRIGEDSEQLYGMILNSISTIYLFLSQFKESLDFAKEALKFNKTLGENTPGYLQSLMSLINVYYNKRCYELIPDIATELNQIKSNQIKKIFETSSSDERYVYWNNGESYWFTESQPKLSYLCNEPKTITTALNGILFSKGILLNSEIEFDNFLNSNGSPVLTEKYNEIKDLRLQLNKLYEKPISQRWCDTDSLERVANNLERELMFESKEFGDYTRNLSITWENVRNNLKDKEVAIEFVHFPLNNDSTMYMAYVLRPGMDSPQMVKLFEEKDLTRLIDEDDKTGIYTDKAASDKVWGKLQPQLEGIENVYFAPDGVLHQIAIEYLPALEGEGMISERYKMHRLSSTREIALNRHTATNKAAVVYGGIKYDIDTTTMVKESQKYEKPKHRGFSPYRNIGDSLAMRASLEYLEGSLKEAKNINGMMKHNNYPITLLTDTIATEESFKNLSGKANSLIHISTHGFYWTESEAERKASINDRLMFMSQVGDNARRNVEDKALTRTGLYMAGAKNAFGDTPLPDGIDDGILTAQEISNLDLRGLDLVVLSACQTGMGDISGDGVFGLQRGFKKAGANTILMSLWDVDDNATQILMTEFYKNYLSGKSKQESLRLAQQFLRNYIDGEEDYSDPKYWAAFILLDALN